MKGEKVGKLETSVLNEKVRLLMLTYAEVCRRILTCILLQDNTLGGTAGYDVRPVQRLQQFHKKVPFQATRKGQQSGLLKLTVVIFKTDC